MTASSTIDVLVRCIRLEAPNIISVELTPVLGSLPAFAPGAHIDFHLSNGMVRIYSLLNSPADRDRYVVGVLNDRQSRGGSRFIHQQLRVGSTIQIAAPRNHFALDESAKRSVLVAGGIGVTPIYCMFNRLRALGREVSLFYAARTRSEAAFAEELLSHGEIVSPHFDDEAGGPPRLKDFLSQFGPDTHYYCCGPLPMIDAFEKACAGLGYPHVHVERFSAGEVETAQDSTYEVTLQRSGRSIAVPAGTSLLDTLLEAGVDVDYSCRDGVCGACETSVIDGETEHRDAVLTERERAANKTMMVCVSGCKGKRLVLDL